MRRILSYVVVIVLFFVALLIQMGVLEVLNGNVSDRTIRYIVLASFGECIATWPFIKKKIIGSKYPLKKERISHRDLKREDIVELENHGECKYDGYYEGYHLFVPKKKLDSGETYIKLRKEEVPELVKK